MLKDLSGSRFGQLVVIQRSDNMKKHAAWLCQCDCGKRIVVRGDALRSGKKTSCGHENSLVGRRYGKLTVVELVSVTKDHHFLWKCKCDCGEYTTATTNSLNCGCRKSCGCINKERIKQLNKTHGMSKTRLYKTWSNMRGRCYIASSSHYSDYGGRGITVCDEWKDSFEAFCDWALKNGYSDELTIDRIDVNGNYCPENCRWITSQMQKNNKRTNRVETFNGETHTLAEWARITGINYRLLKDRIKWGWTIEKALTEPVHRQNKAR